MGKKYETLLNTGNLISKSGLDLGQATGFTVRACEGRNWGSLLLRRGCP